PFPPWPPLAPYQGPPLPPFRPPQPPINPFFVTPSLPGAPPLHVSVIVPKFVSVPFTLMMLPQVSRVTPALTVRLVKFLFDVSWVLTLTIKGPLAAFPKLRS